MCRRSAGESSIQIGVETLLNDVKIFNSIAVERRSKGGLSFGVGGGSMGVVRIYVNLTIFKIISYTDSSFTSVCLR